MQACVASLFLYKSPYKAIISIITIWAFLFNTIAMELAWASKSPSPMLPASGTDDAGSPGHLSKSRAGLNLPYFWLPAVLGEIKHRHIGTNSKTIIYIQDAHCNYSCQKSIENIIKHFNYNLKADLALIEGGTGDYDLSVFTGIEGRKLRKKTANYFLKEGRINGAEFFAINNPHKIILKGLEDPGLYNKNLKIYRGSLKQKGEIDNIIKTLGRYLSSLKDHIYPEALRDFEEKRAAYDNTEFTLSEYLDYMSALSVRLKTEISHHRNISGLIRAKRLEDEIDFKAVNYERLELINELQKRLPQAGLENLIKSASDFKDGALGEIEFCSYLFTKADTAAIDTGKKYPAFSSYKRYKEILGSIEEEALFGEIDELEVRIIEKLCRKKSQKKLRALSEDLSLLRDFFNISLTFEKYRYYKGNRGRFRISRFQSFIKRYAARYGIEVESFKDTAVLDKYRKDFEGFYEYALERDRAFIENINRHCGSGQRDSLIAVTGGFHTENLRGLLKDEGYSYIVILPRFNPAERTPYLRLLSGGLSPIEEEIRARASAISVPRPFCNGIGEPISIQAVKAVEAGVAAETQPQEGIVRKLVRRLFNRATVLIALYTTLTFTGGFYREYFKNPEGMFQAFLKGAVIDVPVPIIFAGAMYCLKVFIQSRGIQSKNTPIIPQIARFMLRLKPKGIALLSFFLSVFFEVLFPCFPAIAVLGGTSFSWLDILAYTIGAGIVYVSYRFLPPAPTQEQSIDLQLEEDTGSTPTATDPSGAAPVEEGESVGREKLKEGRYEIKTLLVFGLVAYMLLPTLVKWIQAQALISAVSSPPATLSFFIASVFAGIVVLSRVFWAEKLSAFDRVAPFYLLAFTILNPAAYYVFIPVTFGVATSYIFHFMLKQRLFNNEIIGTSLRGHAAALLLFMVVPFYEIAPLPFMTGLALLWTASFAHSAIRSTVHRPTPPHPKLRRGRSVSIPQSARVETRESPTTEASGAAPVEDTPQADGAGVKAKKRSKALPPDKGIARSYRVWMEFEKAGNISAKRQRNMGVERVRAEHIFTLKTYVDSQYQLLREYLPALDQINPAVVYDNARVVNGMRFNWGDTRSIFYRDFLFIIEKARVRLVVATSKNGRISPCGDDELEWFGLCHIENPVKRQEFLKLVKRLQVGTLLEDIIYEHTEDAATSPTDPSAAAPVTMSPEAVPTAEPVNLDWIKKTEAAIERQFGILESGFTHRAGRSYTIGVVVKAPPKGEDPDRFRECMDFARVFEQDARRLARSLAAKRGIDIDKTTGIEIIAYVDDTTESDDNRARLEEYKARLKDRRRRNRNEIIFSFVLRGENRAEFRESLRKECGAYMAGLDGAEYISRWGQALLGPLFAVFIDSKIEKIKAGGETDGENTASTVRAIVDSASEMQRRDRDRVDEDIGDRLRGVNSAEKLNNVFDGAEIILYLPTMKPQIPTLKKLHRAEKETARAL